MVPYPLLSTAVLTKSSLLPNLPVFPINGSLRSCGSASQPAQSHPLILLAGSQVPSPGLPLLLYLGGALYPLAAVSFSPPVLIELIDICLVLTFFSLYRNYYSLCGELSLRKLPWAVTAAFHLSACLACSHGHTEKKVYVPCTCTHLQIVDCGHSLLMERVWVTSILFLALM